jgi:hypothetical protein
MTLPRFDVNDFPIETDQPRIEVTLPVGRHVLELVVEDSAGLRSAPSTVVVTVEQSPPVINQIQPNNGTQGSIVRAEIRGENLLGISQVSFSGTGVTASILPGGTNNNVPVEITIAPQATLGGRSFTVTTPGGTATSPTGVQFTVQQNAPVVRSLNPTSGTQGTPSLQVIISGQNLSGAQDVTFSGTGVTLNRIISSDANTVTADIAIATNARTGARNFTVTTPGGRGSSPAGVDFTVLQAVPVITGINPTSGTPGSRVTATINGSNLAGASEVTFPGSGINVDRISGSSDTSVSVNLTIDPNAAVGSRSFTVTTPGGTANSPRNVVFTVQQAAPTISGISPNIGTLGDAVNAIITGSNLSGARAVTFSGAGVTARISGTGTDTQVPVAISIASGAATGAHTFTVLAAAGQADSGDSRVTFTVVGIRPTISPTIGPTIGPTISPTIGPFPTLRPTVTPVNPTLSPTLRPTIIPTISPTIRPIIESATISPNLAGISRAAITNTQPVDTVSGIGPTFRSRLESGGIQTVGDLANAQPAEVARLLGTTEVRAMSFIDSARNMAE